MTTPVRPVRTAVFPVAGWGTRFLPATKAVPKELLTVGDKPVIQYAVEEAKAAGIERFVFITSPAKDAIKKHFSAAPDLEALLERAKKNDLLEKVRGATLPPGQCFYPYQLEQKGLGHAILQAREFVGDEPFAVMLPDMLMMDEEESCLQSMVAQYTKTGGNIIALSECDPDETSKYGIVDIDAHGRIRNMVEKPKPANAPSNKYINGRYILQPDIFEILSVQTSGAGSEIQLTDAMLTLLGDQPFYGYDYKGRLFDCGSQDGWDAANLYSILQRNPNLPANMLHERTVSEIKKNITERAPTL